jgi:hypothetical protein
MKGQSQERRVKSPEATGGKSEQNSEGSTDSVIYRSSEREYFVNNSLGSKEWLVGAVI